MVKDPVYGMVVSEDKAKIIYQGQTNTSHTIEDLL